LVILLEIYYTVHNFSVKLVATYALSIIIFVYVTFHTSITFVKISLLNFQMISTIILSEMIESNLLDVIQFVDSFPLRDVLGPEVRSFVTPFKNSTRINLRFYIICGTATVIGVLFCPFCDSYKEWILAEIIFEEYLSPWSLLLYHIFYWSLPFLIYNTIRPCLILLYTTAEMCLQVSLINQRILQDCVDDVDFDKLKIVQQISYQNKIFRTLCSCIDHHVLIIRYTTNTIQIFLTNCHLFRMFKKLLATLKLPMVILLWLTVPVFIIVIFANLYVCYLLT
jgi:hypothetical protein